MKDLHKIIGKHGNKKFRYGSSDCCMFAANVVRDMHGIDFAEKWRGYKGKKQAIKLLKELGGMEEHLTKLLGKPAPRLKWRRGDPVMADTPDGLAVGVCCGNTSAFKAREGVLFMPTRLVLKGWNV